MSDIGTGTIQLLTWWHGQSDWVHPLASLLTPSCVALSICWKEGIPSRRTLTGLRVRAVWTSWSLTWPNIRSCTWAVSIPSTDTVWMENELRVALRGRALCWEAQQELLMCTCIPEGQPYPGQHQKKYGRSAGRGRWFFTSAPLLWDPTCSTAFSSEAHNIRRTWTCWIKCGGEHEDAQRAGAPHLWREVAGAGLVQPGEEECSQKTL